MKVAYALGTRAHCTGDVTKVTYAFRPWADVDERDWPGLKARTMITSGCCGKPSRVRRAFVNEEEWKNGTVETVW
jgi:hypothetical protein